MHELEGAEKQDCSGLGSFKSQRRTGSAQESEILEDLEQDYRVQGQNPLEEKQLHKLQLLELGGRRYEKGTGCSRVRKLKGKISN